MLSTLADEALDIPRLDRGYLTFPQSNTGLITQQVGRFEREHPDKKDARIYDFVDRYVAEMKAQYEKRKYKVYLPRGYKITRIKMEDL
jgi:superfamily II DNA or RNA helicase